MGCYSSHFLHDQAEAQRGHTAGGGDLNVLVWVQSPALSPHFVLLFAAGLCSTDAEWLWAVEELNPEARPRDNEAHPAWPWVGGSPASNTDGLSSFLLPDQAAPQL